MKSEKFQILRLLSGWTLLSVILFFPGCVSKQVDRDSAEGLYQSAEQSFKDENYLSAREKFRDIKNRFPYSSRAVEAELRIADTYYAEESYIEAESAYSIFAELHPTYPRSDYVHYRVGLSYYHQIPSNIARDLTAAHKTIEAFENLFRKFPNSEYSEKGKNFVRLARQKLAEHERYVANFYYQREHYLSSSYRYASLLREYPRLGYDEEALYRLGQCYYHIRMYANAKNALQRLMKEYPKSEFSSSARNLLNELNRVVN